MRGVGGNQQCWLHEDACDAVKVNSDNLKVLLSETKQTVMQLMLIIVSL